MYNKKIFENRLAALKNSANNPIVPCYKLETQAIVQAYFAIENGKVVIIYPMDSGINKYMYRVEIVTPEQRNGCEYAMVKYAPLCRKIGNTFIMRDEDVKAAGDVLGEEYLDSYCWTREKIEKMVAQGKTEAIGTASRAGLRNLMAFANGLSDKELDVLTETFAMCSHDMILATTPAENRFGFRITQELYDAGWDFCIDEWMETDENGMAKKTKLSVGDVVVVTYHDDGTVSGYRVEGAIFDKTYLYNTVR